MLQFDDSWRGSRSQSDDPVHFYQKVVSIDSKKLVLSPFNGYGDYVILLFCGQSLSAAC